MLAYGVFYMIYHRATFHFEKSHHFCTIQSSKFWCCQSDFSKIFCTHCGIHWTYSIVHSRELVGSSRCWLGLIRPARLLTFYWVNRNNHCLSKKQSVLAPLHKVSSLFYDTRVQLPEMVPAHPTRISFVVEKVEDREVVVFHR